MTSAICYAHDAGGLCNRIFPFAHLLAFSQLTGRRLVNPTFRQYSSYFLGTNPAFADEFGSLVSAEVLRPQLSMRWWRQRFKIASHICKKQVLSLSDDEFLDLEILCDTGRLNKVSWVSGLYTIHNTGFQQYAGLIRSFFRPIPSIESEVRDILFVAKAGVDVLVGVHIRHGDYATHADGFLYFDVTEYRQLMDRMVEQFSGKKVRFLVCSNVQQPDEAFSGLAWAKGPGSEIGDLIALAGCDYIIGPASTYSEWASFYGQVPRFVHNRKFEEKHGIASTRLELKYFEIHRRGYGKFKAIDDTGETSELVK